LNIDHTDQQPGIVNNRQLIDGVRPHQFQCVRRPSLNSDALGIAGHHLGNGSIDPAIRRTEHAKKVAVRDDPRQPACVVNDRGSAGTSGDRATLDIELTDAWLEYAVRWRPSADRTDAEVAVYATDQVALDVLVDSLHIWSPLASQVDNGALETNTTGWDATGAYIAGASTLAHVTGGAFAGTGHARLTTTATSGSGVSFPFGVRTFVAGRTYRARVGLRYESGATSARLRLGSVGTPADRGDETVTITGTYAWHTVDWTPSADRTDVALAISNASAAAVVLLFDEVETYEALDEVSLSGVSTTRGATSPGAGAGRARPGIAQARLQGPTRARRTPGTHRRPRGRAA